jgi:inorganic phosphate transporter, PiT family
MFFFFLLSGLFLGWSLGANDAANVFGTAVGTRMIRFKTAAIVLSVFVIIGAVAGGAGTTHTLGKLGAVNALAGSFTVALAAAMTVTWMTRLSLPVSTSQAIVGAIVGWNLFSGSVTDGGALTKIVLSWVLCPILAAIFAAALLRLAQASIAYLRPSIFRIDAATRHGLILVGAFASYSLGANNIANVMGVFVPSAPFAPLDIFGLIQLSAAQQLFLLGGIAIAVGVFTYSERVMLTVGGNLFRLSPISALVVVMAQAVVLFLFSSEGLEHLLASNGLPTIPLVPVSSSQAVVGAVIGIGLTKGGRNIRFRVLARISSGWVSTPVIAAVISFVSLFFVQNVFSQRVYEPVQYELTAGGLAKLELEEEHRTMVEDLSGRRFESGAELSSELASRLPETADIQAIVALSKIEPMRVDLEQLRNRSDVGWLTPDTLKAMRPLQGKRYMHLWQLRDDIETLGPEWCMLPRDKKNKLHNRRLRERVTVLARLFAEEPEATKESSPAQKR